MNRQAGFTLIEVMIALAILAGMGAIAVPRLAETYDRISFSLAREDVERAIGGLGEKARHDGHSLDLVTESDLVPVPSGWRLVTDQPIHYRFDGICFGGQVTIEAIDQSRTYRLDPPFCRPNPIS